MSLLRYRAETKIRVGLRRTQMQLKSAFVTNKATFSHVTIYAAGNAGDTVLSECVRRTFNKMLNQFSWKLVSVMHPVSETLIEKFNRTNAVIIGGGGLFLPDTNPNAISGWQWACSKENLSRIRVPIILYSVGYNYFRGQIPSTLFIDSLSEIVEKSSFVGLRNHGSVCEVKALLRDDLKEKVVYQPCTTTLLRLLCPDLPAKKESGKIAFNFAFDRAEKRFGENKEKILVEIVKSVYAIRDKGYEIYIVAHCPSDLMVMQYIKERTNIHVVNASWWGFEQLAGFYNNMDVVLGMRGHAQMIPFGLNCQIISLGSHEKMKWFLEDIDAMDWYIEMIEQPETLAERIMEKFVEVHEINRDLTNQRLVKAQQYLWEITCDNMNYIRSVIEEPFGG